MSVKIGFSPQPVPASAPKGLPPVSSRAPAAAPAPAPSSSFQAAPNRPAVVLNPPPPPAPQRFEGAGGSDAQHRVSSRTDVSRALTQERRPVDTELIGLSNGSKDGSGDANAPGPVRRLQSRLVELGITTPEETQAFQDGAGTFGGTTEGVLERFQASQGLPETGVVDELTAQALANPRNPVDIAREQLGETRDRVRAQAEKTVMDSIPQEAFLHLPPAEQAALRQRAQQAGEAAVRQFDRDVRALINEEAQQAGLSPEQLRNLPPEDREAALAGPTLAALRRVNMSLDALELSAAQMDPATGTMVNSNNGLSVSQDNDAWNYWCLAFVSSSYSRDAAPLHATSAINAANAADANGTLQTDRDYASWPPGAPVFFEATSNNKNYGHVAIFTGRFNSEGEPIMRTSGWNNHPGITEVPLSYLEDKSGAYMGYVPYPDASE